MLITCKIGPLKSTSLRKKLTPRLSHTQLVTLAVYLLGGRDRFVDTEDVAVKCHELAPERFSWRRYPEHPNLEGVRVRLLEETKAPQASALVRGSHSRGWKLTPTGLAWAIEASKSVGSIGATDTPPDRGGSVDAQRVKRDRERVAGSAAWSKWPDRSSSISPQEAAEVLRLDSYATPELQTLKLDRLRMLHVGDREIQDFLNHLEQCLKK